MKKRIVLICFLFTFIAHLSMAQLQTPAPSPFSTVSQVVGLTEVEIAYSRPAMKGRTIFGGLEPYGELWRTGANAATTISFDEPMSIEGKEIPAGEYSIFSIPGKKEWTIILNKDAKASEAAYKESEDAARFTVKSQKLDRPYESFTIMFSDVKENAAKINIMWENTLVQFGIQDPDVDEKVMAQIEKQIPSAGNNDNVYFAAASYYFENGKDLQKAAEWVDKAVAINGEKFWVMHLQAKIHAKLNNKEKAIAAAQKSKELAEKAGNPDYVKLNDTLIASMK
jgi:tetratricopeptide (TPR) repeat protein